MKDKYIVMFTGLKGMLNKGNTGPWGRCQGGHGPVIPREAGSWELPASTAGPDNPALGPVASGTARPDTAEGQGWACGPGTRGHSLFGDRMGLESSWLCPWSLSGIQGQHGPAPHKVSSLGAPSPCWGWGQIWDPQELLLVPVGSE